MESITESEDAAYEAARGCAARSQQQSCRINAFRCEKTAAAAPDGLALHSRARQALVARPRAVRT